MKANLTHSVVDALKSPKTGQIDYWDTKLPGFGLRVSMGGTKTWLVRYRQNGHRRRYALGSFPRLGVADARQAARQYLGKVAEGNDPAAERATVKAEPTFADVAKLFLERHAINKRPRSRSEYKRMLRADLLP